MTATLTSIGPEKTLEQIKEELTKLREELGAITYQGAYLNQMAQAHLNKISELSQLQSKLENPEKDAK